MMRLLGLVLALVLLAGCGDGSPEEPYAARVGEAFLTEADVQAALATLPNPLDTTEARQQLIEQWVTNELLYQEALRRDLRQRETVQRRLLESERAVLIEALVASLYAEQQDAIPAADVSAYFERHKERMQLREPFVRVRYLAATARDSAEAARRALQQAISQGDADSVWMALIDRYADDVDGARALATMYLPESRLFADRPALRQRLETLARGQVAPVLEADDRYVVLQLADRKPAGTVPELPWVEAEVRRQLAIEARKQMFERQVERLRAEAQARDGLDVSGR